jgi:hypothetical protein
MYNHVIVELDIIFERELEPARVLYIELVVLVIFRDLLDYTKVRILVAGSLENYIKLYNR